MKKLMIMATSAMLLSCTSNKNISTQDRHIASLAIEQIMVESPQNLNEALNERLKSLHNYYIIGYQNLGQFDSLINTLSTDELYEREEYLKLIAVRTQVEEIEHELIDLNEKLKSTKSLAKSNILKESIAQFHQSSPMAQYTMQNLSHQLGYKLGNEKSKVAIKHILPKELDLLVGQKEFMIYEKNIEHLALSYDTKNLNTNKFEPSTARKGNITGNEFPSKVWSLTFDDGPGTKTTRSILADLKKRKMKASFFQLTSKAKQNKTVSKELRDAGMEIALHSYTHKQLTKVGAAELEKEITTALKDLKTANDGYNVEFFRLPYGAGVNNTSIRQKIADNKLIHVFWNVDTLDWMAQPVSDIVKRTINLMGKTKNDAGVILFHDIHNRTAEAAPMIMDYLQKDGRRVCTLKTIVSDINKGVETVCSK